MSTSRLKWYASRLRGMSAEEVSWRALDQVRKQVWSFHQVRPGVSAAPASCIASPRFVSVLPPGTREAVPPELGRELIRAADLLLEGRWEALGVWREDLVEPDWFLDPISGRRAPQAKYAFRIDHRSAEECGNVKQLWELSRHQHLTILAGAWFLTGEEAYASAVARQLRSWWRENPFLSGVHWTSGIELGIRLISWVWIRRLLEGWPGAPDLFEANSDAVTQVYWHQRYLAGFRSRGSSSNNHVIAEAAGQLIGSCAFPWFAQSGRWRAGAAQLLERELRLNTFPSGLNREQATDYQGFVAELGLLGAVEADVVGRPLGADTWRLLSQMVDATAALLDERQRPPRQGDSDDGRALLVDPPGVNRWVSLLATGRALYGGLPWWPASQPTMMSTLVGKLSERPHPTAERPIQRPSYFADGGLTLLRTAPGELPELWCRCDGGPHGFLSIAAHAHADALSVEVRYGGVDILADPGTYCYHGEPAWRSYFRSTLAHNTLEVAARDQSRSGGPFLWVSHARAELVEVELDERGAPRRWRAEHTGYDELDPPARHRRTVELDPVGRSLVIVDTIESAGRHQLRMAFHLGPSVVAELDGRVAQLSWPMGAGSAEATLSLADGLRWRAHRGETEPVLGWYSDRFGAKEPTTTILGSGSSSGERLTLYTELRFSR